jgi:hypothetical protein
MRSVLAKSQPLLNDFAFTQKVAKLMDEVHLSKTRLKAYFDIMTAIGHETMIDLKFCPDHGGQIRIRSF